MTRRSRGATLPAKGPHLRPPREEDFPGRMHDERLSARLGLWLGIAFTVCFFTGLLSHLVQHPPSWFWYPTRPVALYRVTQGVHVLSGIAAVPLLLAKLYTVYPKLFTWPPVRSVLHAAERASLLVLIGSAFFELVTGLLNIAHWYPWGFFFPAAHYAMAWVAVGAIVVHVGAKLPIIRRALTTPLDGESDVSGGVSPTRTDPEGDAPSRRAFLRATGLASFVVVLATAGATVPWLRWVSVLAVRDGDGPQGVPINKTAESAGVIEAAHDPTWQLTVSGPGGEATFSLADLQAMEQRSVELPIACVEGWSALGRWTGVRVRDLVDRVGAPPDADVRFESLQQGGLYRASVLPARHVRDELSLVAVALHGEPLDIQHGFPARLITPSRPGILQTKWLSRIEVLA